MLRPGKEPIPAPVPTPLTKSLTIQLTLSGRDLEYFNSYREAVHALDPDNWPMTLRRAFTGLSDQKNRYIPLKATAGEALAKVFCEQAEAQLRTPGSNKEIAAQVLCCVVHNGFVLYQEGLSGSRGLDR